jgi:hypothetical protein
MKRDLRNGKPDLAVLNGGAKPAPGGPNSQPAGAHGERVTDDEIVTLMCRIAKDALARWVRGDWSLGPGESAADALCKLIDAGSATIDTSRLVADKMRQPRRTS